MFGSGEARYKKCVIERKSAVELLCVKCMTAVKKRNADKNKT